MDLLERTVACASSRPEAKCVEDPNRALSYSGFLEAIASVRTKLRSSEIGTESRVALYLPNSVDWLVWAYACLGAGIAFCPISVNDPTERTGGLLRRWAPHVTITSRVVGNPLPPDSGRKIYVEDTLVGASPHIATSKVPPESPAYCIFTSGSTGDPKGVRISRLSLDVAALNTAEDLEFSADTRALCMSPFNFDGAFGSLFGIPQRGGSLVIVSPAIIRKSRSLIQLLRAEHITHLSLAPSVLNLLLETPHVAELRDSAIQSIAVGGENFPVELAQKVTDLLPSVRLYNRYGPTEATIAVSTCRITPAILERGAIPLGRPHSGTEWVVIDPSTLGPHAGTEGAVGELCIGGPQLMIDYWQDSAATSEVLRTDILNGKRLYRTGDLVLNGVDHELQYVGRADSIVKRAGVRISLRELDHHLARYPGVSAAHTVAVEEHLGVRIVAFVSAGSADVSSRSILEVLGQRLPANMLPDEVVTLRELPLTAAGKVDSQTLLEDYGKR